MDVLKVFLVVMVLIASGRSLQFPIPSLVPNGADQTNVANPMEIIWYRFDFPEVPNWKGDVTLKLGESCHDVGLLVALKPSKDQAFYFDLSSSCSKVWTIDRTTMPVGEVFIGIESLDQHTMPYILKAVGAIKIEPGKLITTSSFNGFPAVFRFEVPEGTENFFVSTALSNNEIKLTQLIGFGKIPAEGSGLLGAVDSYNDHGDGCLSVKDPQAGTYFFVAKAETEMIFNNLNVRVDLNAAGCVCLTHPVAVVLADTMSK